MLPNVPEIASTKHTVWNAAGNGLANPQLRRRKLKYVCKVDDGAVRLILVVVLPRCGTPRRPDSSDFSHAGAPVLADIHMLQCLGV